MVSDKTIESAAGLIDAIDSEHAKSIVKRIVAIIEAEQRIDPNNSWLAVLAAQEARQQYTASVQALGGGTFAASGGGGGGYYRGV